MRTSIALGLPMGKREKRNRAKAPTKPAQAAVSTERDSLHEAIEEGLRDIANKDYVEVRAKHTDEDISAIFRSFSKP